MARMNANLSSVSDQEVEEVGTWRVIPDGEYAAIVTESTYGYTKSGKGEVLGLKFKVIDGQHRDRSFREFFTIVHENKDTERIARAKLVSVAKAMGHPNPRHIMDSDELHNRPFMAVVTSEAASERKYGDINGMQNRLHSAKAIGGLVHETVRTVEGPSPAAEGRLAVHGDAGSQTSDEIPF